MVGAFECLGAVIGTIRLLPLNQGLAPCDSYLANQPGLASGMLDNAWEVGRLVLAPEYRAGPELLRRCLFLTLSHMVDHTPARHFFASCRPVLARLYRRCGMAVLAKSIAGPDEEPFSLIHGDVGSIMQAVSDDEPAGPSRMLQ